MGRGKVLRKENKDIKKWKKCANKREREISEKWGRRVE